MQALFFSIDSASWIGRMGSIAAGVGLAAVGGGLFFQKRAEGGSKAVQVTQRTIGVALVAFGVGVAIVGWQAF